MLIESALQAVMVGLGLDSDEIHLLAFKNELNSLLNGSTEQKIAE